MIAKRYSLDQEAVSFSLLVIGVVVIAVVVGFSLLIALYLNNSRQSRVIAEYTAETERFVEVNRGQLTQLFTTAMDTCREIYPPLPANSPSPSHDCEAARIALDSLQQEELSDFSATAFMRAQDGRIEMIESSGRYHRPALPRDSYVLGWNTREELNLHLFQNKKINFWQDFLTYIPGKEVLVPVALDNGIEGYIFRGVIER